MRSLGPAGRYVPQRWANILLIILAAGAYSAHGRAAVLHVPGGYPSIQAGLAAAHPGDTVLVAPGVYYESLTMVPGVHIHGQPGAILDGGQTFGPVVRALSGVDATPSYPVWSSAAASRRAFFLTRPIPPSATLSLSTREGRGLFVPRPRHAWSIT
jgi:hypothetical protein